MDEAALAIAKAREPEAVEKTEGPRESKQAGPNQMMSRAGKSAGLRAPGPVAAASTKRPKQPGS